MIGHRQTLSTPARQRGFTIVELLIVIIVIAILAAIVIIAYNGVTQKAQASAAQSAARDLAQLLTNSYTTNGTYPNDLSTVNNGGPMPTNGTSYAYHPGTGNSSYCATVTNGHSSYMVTDTVGTPTAGACAGDGVNGVPPVTNLATNPSLESDTTGWWVATWGTGGSGSLSRPSGGGYVGSQFLRGTWSAAPSVSEPYVIGTTTNATVGSTYSCGAYARTSWSTTMAARMVFRDSTNTWLAQVSGADTSTNSSGWTRITTTGTAPASTANFFCIFVVRYTMPSIGSTLDLDGLMINTGSSLLNYADGTTSGWIWNGATNDSTSTGPPQ